MRRHWRDLAFILTATIMSDLFGFCVSLTWLLISHFLGICRFCRVQFFFPFVDLRNHEAARCQVMDLPNFMKVKLMFLNPNSPSAKTSLLEVAKEVNSVLNRGNGTIVHCNAGVHRAPQCTAALISGLKSVSYKAAVTWLIVKTWTHQVQRGLQVTANHKVPEPSKILTRG